MKISNLLERASKTNTFLYTKTFNFWAVFISLCVFFFIFTMFIKNFSYAYEGYRLGFDFFDLTHTVFDIANTFANFYIFLFLIISVIISSFNITLLLKYIKIIKDVNEKFISSDKEDNISASKITKKIEVKKLGFGMTLAMLATHCASCGAALFGGIISLSFLSYLPFAGYEIGVLGIMILIYTSYDIIKKLNNPYVC